jgi:hypothetical protein
MIKYCDKRISEIIKATCLQMSQTILRKANLSTMYNEFRKSKHIQDQIISFTRYVRFITDLVVFT